MEKHLQLLDKKTLSWIVNVSFMMRFKDGFNVRFSFHIDVDDTRRSREGAEMIVEVESYIIY